MSQQLDLLTAEGTRQPDACERPVLAVAPGWAFGELALLPALSVRQPWATSIVHFGKPLENRCWSGRYLALQLAALRRAGNRFLIHASQGMTRDEMAGWRHFVEERGVAPSAEEMARAGVKTFRDLPRGGIVGVARFVRWVTASDNPWWIGPGALEVADVQPLDFLPCKGALGFFRLPNVSGLPRPLGAVGSDALFEEPAGKSTNKIIRIKMRINA